MVPHLVPLGLLLSTRAFENRCKIHFNEEEEGRKEEKKEDKEGRKGRRKDTSNSNVKAKSNTLHLLRFTLYQVFGLDYFFFKKL